MLEEQSEQEMSLPSICYGLAYFLLPQKLFSDADKIIGYFRDPKLPPAVYLYSMACIFQNVKPQREDAMLFNAHSGSLDDDTAYYVIKYPTPPPFILGDRKSVLSPFFSAILHHQSAGNVTYYVLGQRPAGGTTLRTVQPKGINTNLGEGPAPVLAEFLDVLRGRD
jgi:hypothetical protein